MSIVSNNKGLEKSRAKAIELFKQNFSSVDGNEEAIKSWLTSIGLDENSVTQLFSEANISIERISNFISEKFSQASQDFIRANYFKTDQTNKALKSTISDRNKRISAKKDAIGEATGRQTEYKRQVDSLEKQTEVISAQVSTKEITDLENKIATIQQRISEIQQQLLAQKPTGVNTPQIPNRKIADENLQAVNEAERFQDNLKESISHWLSAQMIITKVREGIHQAWVDIQGLDKAMTNIAVVTDMSVSDLWGKINDYMAIAQDYGVTTQGVYEVSQLYYQQGLSTSEVMEATTETLKMARIAGMDYTEAADAMTVAIRAFKMEMSDAQVITDVYSKVAAVTASDSQELAIAMSKTASSAESVGSSFENTTAMLAVMIETTRESAQNLGSALKSIISRYGEMKTGLTVDSEGEAIDYNKVDTALQSVGISIKDAQGQFRDFDDVIFELSKKWDSLDKNTQRYIATIMAGNRQQSRFIALVDNGERLKEVMDAAHNSADAGLLQYAKTLDSLETKLNALSTSFQQFYMNIVNGGFFKGVVDIITNFLNGLNELSTLNGILNIATLINGLKLGLTTVVTVFANSFGEVYKRYKELQKKMTSLAIKEGSQRGQASAQAEAAAMEQTTQVKRRRRNGQNGVPVAPAGKIDKAAAVSLVASILGTAVSGWGTTVLSSNDLTKKSEIGSHFTNNVAGSVLSTTGNVANGIATGIMLGNAIPVVGSVAGGIIGGLIPAITGLIDITKAWENVERERYKAFTEEAKELNIKRAEVKNDFNTLKELLKKYDNIKENRYNDASSYQEWLNINNQLIEAYPGLLDYIDAEGNAIADVTKKSELLATSMTKATEASYDYYLAEIRSKKQKIVAAKATSLTGTGWNVTEDNIDPFFTEVGKVTYSDYYTTGPKAYYETDVEKIVNWAQNHAIDLNELLVKQQLGILEGSEKQLFENLKLLKVYTESNGKYSLNKDVETVLFEGNTEKEIRDLQNKLVQDQLNFVSSSTGLDDELVNISGWTNLLTSYALNFKNYNWQSLSRITPEDYNELIKEFTNFYNSLSNTEKDIFKTLYDNLDSYGLKEFQTLADNLDMKGDILSNYQEAWYKKNIDAKYLAIKALYPDSQIITYEEYLKQLEAEGKTGSYEDYWKTYIDSFGNIAGHINKWIAEASPQETQAYVNWIKRESDIRANGDYRQKSASGKRIELINTGLASGRLFGIDLAQLEKEQEQALYNLTFSEDAGTTEWKEAIISFGKEVGQLFGVNLSKLTEEQQEAYFDLITAENFGEFEWQIEKFALEQELGFKITDIPNFSQLIYENYNTVITKAIDEVDNSIDSIDDLTKKQKSGFKLEDANKLFKQLTKIDPTLTWEDIFEYNEKGVLALKDLSTTIDTIYGKESSILIESSNAISQAKQLLQNDSEKREGINNLLSFVKFMETKEDVSTIVDQISSMLKLTDSQSDLLLQQINEGVITTVEQLEKWLKDLGIQVDNASEFFERGIRQIKGKEAFKQYTKNERNFDFISKIDNGLSREDIWNQYSANYLNDLVEGTEVTSEDIAKFFENSGMSFDYIGKGTIVNPEELITWIANREGIPTDSEDYKRLAEKIYATYIINKDTVTTKLNDSINSLLSDPTSASIKELRDLYHKATGLEANSELTQSYYDAIVEAKNGNIELLRTYILEIARQASLKDISIDVEKINHTLATAQQKLSSVLIKGLEAAIKGTLSANDMATLSKELRIDIQQYANSTIDGYKVSAEGLLKIGTEMVQKYGNTYDVAKKLSKLFIGEGGIYKGYRDIVKAAEELNKKIEDAADSSEKTTAEYRKQKKLLTEMAKIAMFNNDDPLFKFMDQDPTKGYGLSAESMAKSIDKVKDSFKSIRKKKNISSSDFYNMMDFMYDQLGDWDSFASALGISDATLAKLKVSTEEGVDIYSSFVNAIVSQSKELGEVDADVLIGLGLSAKKMAGGMSKSLKEVADDQIAQLNALRETLVAMKSMEELGNIELGLGLDFTAKDGTEIDLLNFDKYLDEFDEGKIKTISSAIQNKLDEVTSILVKNGATNFTWSTLFGDDGFTIDNETEQAYVKNIGKFIQMYGDDVTSETWTAFARRFTQEGEKLNWQGLIEAIANMQDWETFTYGLTNEIQKNINDGLAKTNIEGITIDGSSIKVEEGVDTTPIIEKIKAEYGKYGYTSIEVSADGGEIKVTVVDATIKTQIDASRSVLDDDGNPILNWQFMADETYQAQAQIDDIDVVFTVNGVGEVTYRTKNNKLINKNNVKEFLNNNGLNIDTVIEEGSFSNSATFNLVTAGGEETASTVSTINEDVRAIRTALENPIKIDVDDQASNKLDTIKESYNLLADTLEARPLVINAQGDSLSSVVSSKDGEKSGETDLPTLTQKISVSWEGLDGWKKDKELIQPVKVKYNFGEYERSGLTQEVTVNYTVGTVEKPNLDGTGGDTQTQNEKPKKSEAKGNVNLLKLGAAYAHGTLMGELGPELYVQNGAYHIAGAHGPEFVDLDPDAIVFNHLQTANLLGKGYTSKTGSPVISEHRSVAFATGNVSGPAMASGIDSAIEAIDRAIAMWQNIANSTTKDLLNNSGKNKDGGSGNTLKAVTKELEEWYNLTRQIEDIEQEITNLTAERANIRKEDGESYLRSLREEQKLLNQQIATQHALLDYQELQLQRQAKHIEQNAIWSQFLTVDENGLLQYISGNETNGGKGALQVLQELNQMSGKEQTAYLKKLGYSYTDNDGKVLEGTKLVEQFFKELQKQIEQYDALYDTVRGTEKTLENLKTKIEQINEEIKQNQMDLEQAVFDIIVKAWEKEIKQMEEQAGLIKEANKAYIDGLNEALSVERQLYEDNQKIADREQLQRQLSLLRRSGGSASEIANLEEQLNDMLKDEYFSNQKQMIEDIQQANDIQVQQLETQIRLQEEALEFQKEHGVIWTQVYEVLSKSRKEILAFMQGNSTEFFSKSLLQQEQMLTEWAHKIGIYKEDQKYQNYANHAQTNIWENGQAWNIGDMSKYQSTYNNLTDEEKNTIRDQFTSVYAQARLDGKDHNTAAAEAAVAVSQTLKRKQDANNAQNNTPETTIPNPTNPGGGSSGGSSGSSSSGGSSGGSSYSSVKITVTAGDGHGNPLPQTATVSPKQTFTIQTNPDSGYDFDYITYNGTKKYSNSITPTGQVSSIAIKVYYKQSSSSTTTNNSSSSSSNNSSSSSSSQQGWHYQLNGPNGERESNKTVYSTREKAQAAGAEAVRKKGSGWKYSTKYYSQGGLVDYTGVAMVHGSKTKPESFLNAEQTAQIREGLKESGKGGALEGIKAALLKLDSSIKAVTNISNKSESNSYTIAPGAVVIQVEQLNDAYDVDTLSADIMNRMYAIGNKSTNRGVSRR